MKIYSEIRTRFAPSPTGFVHVGSLRTALFSFLFARKMGGKNILRIEDTDQNRLVEGAVENLIKVLGEVGIEFDEGFFLNPDGSLAQTGEYGPYLQSERLSIYQKHAEELLNSGHAYYCFCSEERLDILRKEQVALKKPPMYDGLCRNMSLTETQKKLEEFKENGTKPVIRQAIPKEGQTIIHDLIYKDILVENKILDDQVLIKSDGFPTYHLAVVVDDHLMKITHVIRGEEWIASTPKHLLLYKAFGWEPTEFAHLPLILNPDKTKLSKRQGDVSVESYLNKGYLKEALINFVAFLGWNPKTSQEIFSLEELISSFDLSKINKAGAVFDLEKLDWMNGLYIRNTNIDELTYFAKPFWKTAKLIDDAVDFEFLKDIMSLEKERLKKISDIVDRTRYFFEEPDYETALLVWKKSDLTQTLNVLKDLRGLFENMDSSISKKSQIEEYIRAYITNNSLDLGTVLWPLRVSMSGLAASPGPFEITEVLLKAYGKEKIVTRLKKAISKIESDIAP